jgi:hypothetical protein
MTSSRATAFRVIVVLGVLCAGLAVACVLLARRVLGEAREGAGPLSQQAIDDPALREQALEELVKQGSGVWDTFPDPEVGVILQPKLVDRPFYGAQMSTNSRGLREREYALPKPPGTIRVVLLGDSFIMGQSIEADERFGVALERWLAEKAGREHGPIEVLNFGVSTWNIAAETAFVMHQLTPLAPDLVIHVVVRNDLEDGAGARGFGEMANWNPGHPERGAAVFQAHHPIGAFGTRQTNWLHHGLDWESRSRFEAAAADITRLAKAVAEGGGRYLMLDYYTGLLPVSRKFLTGGLDPQQVAYLPTALIQDVVLRVSEKDPHWNAAGNQLVAKLVYALIQQRGLLPQLALPDWKEASDLAADWLGRGEKEAAAEPQLDRVPGRRTIEPSVDFAKLDDDRAAQVHGGIFAGGAVTPYASIILRCDGRKLLQVAGDLLDRRELDGAHVDVFVDEARVGELPLQRGQKIDATFDVPDEIAKRKFVSARFVASDYAYDEKDLRIHVVFMLRSVGLR